MTWEHRFGVGSYEKKASAMCETLSLRLLFKVFIEMLIEFRAVSGLPG